MGQDGCSYRKKQRKKSANFRVARIGRRKSGCKVKSFGNGKEIKSLGGEQEWGMAGRLCLPDPGNLPADEAAGNKKATGRRCKRSLYIEINLSANGPMRNNTARRANC